MYDVHPFSDKIPEPNHKPLKEMVNLCFKQLNEVEKCYIIEYIFGKLSLAFGGFAQFWQDEEEMTFIKQGWVEGCSDLSVKQILCGLYMILKGRTHYVTKPPRAPMEFYHICKNSAPMPDFQQKKVDLRLNITANKKSLLTGKQEEAEIVIYPERNILVLFFGDINTNFLQLAFYFVVRLWLSA